MRKKITPGRINRFFGILLAIFLAIGGFLFWQGHISEIGLFLFGVIALIAGISFVFGVRSAQKDGFLDGYARAKDDFDKEKKG